MNIFSIFLIVLLLSSTFGFTTNAVAQSIFPEWVKILFSWYSQGKISDKDLLNTLNYLVDKEIILLNSFDNSYPGNFKLIFSEPESQFYKELKSEYQKDTGFYDLVDGLNKNFKLKKDVTINIKECGISNAFYDEQNSEIILCYELFEYYYNFFSNQYKNEELDNVTTGAILFILFHELGHALVDNYDLPITGKEEDAVDQFSTIILLHMDETGDESLYAIESWFLTKSQKTDELKFWSKHSIVQQRLYNIMCMVYGENPDDNQHLIANGLLPDSRLDECVNEYHTILKSWDSLLAPYWKIS